MGKINEGKNKIGSILNKQVIISEILISVVLVLLYICSGVTTGRLVYYIFTEEIFVFLECAIIYAIQRETGSFQVKMGYIREQHCYEKKVGKWEANRSIAYWVVRFALLMIVLFAIPILVAVKNEVYEKVADCRSIVLPELKENGISIGVGAYGVLLTLLTIVATYLKNKSFLFEIDQNRMIRKSMWYMVISIILFFVTEGFYIASADKIGNIVSIVWLLSIVILIVLLLYTLVTIYRQTYEKRIIKEMYKIYWCKKIVITPNKVWFKSNMLEGIGTLFSDFIKKVRKLQRRMYGVLHLVMCMRRIRKILKSQSP